MPSIRRYRCTRSRPATTPPKPCAGRLASEPDLCFTGKGHDGWSAALAQRHVEIERLPGIESDVVRADALAALDQLPGGTRASVVRRVCVLGAESTGKTTLARDLADALATVWVPEYGRDYTETLPDRLRYVWTTPDFEIISKRQNWNEDRAARYANRIVIVDTDAFATSLFHELYVGYRAPELDAYLRRYDLYLLTSIDTPFQMDVTGLRYDGDTRAFMDATYRRHAEESGAPWAALARPAAGATAHGRRGGRGDARALCRPRRADRPARAGARARGRTLRGAGAHFRTSAVVGGLEASGSGSRLADPVGTHSRAGILSREAPWFARLFERAKGRRRSGCRAIPLTHHP